MFKGIEHLKESGEKKLSPQETADKIIERYDEGKMKIVEQAADKLEDAFLVTGISDEDAEQILEKIKRSVGHRKETTH